MYISFFIRLFGELIGEEGGGWSACSWFCTWFISWFRSTRFHSSTGRGGLIGNTVDDSYRKFEYQSKGTFTEIVIYMFFVGCVLAYLFKQSKRKYI